MLDNIIKYKVLMVNSVHAFFLQYKIGTTNCNTMQYDNFMNKVAQLLQRDRATQ